MISIIIPVYREVENIPCIAEQINHVLSTSNINYEIIFVDDNSCDGTDQACEKLKKALPVRLITRTKDKGLSQAVIEGFFHARGNIFIVMDCDLSHPPSSIVDMVEILKAKGADLVIGSRYVTGGSIDKTWSLFRHFNSKAATLLALPLVKINDPMSGFFALRAENLPDIKALSPVGYKINLELIVKGKFKHIIELPIHFSERIYGKSKMGFKEQFLYLRHLISLYHHSYPIFIKFFLFSSVGATGFLIDVNLYLLFQKVFSMEHIIARALSFWPAVSWNWLLNRTVTFKDRAKKPKLSQWLKFCISSAVGFSVNWGVYYLLTENIVFFQKNLMAAFITGVLSAALFNYLLSYYYIFSFFKTRFSAVSTQTKK